MPPTRQANIPVGAEVEETYDVQDLMDLTASFHTWTTPIHEIVRKCLPEVKNENAVDALAAWWAGFIILPGLIRAIPQIYSGTTVVAFLRKAAESVSPGKFVIKHARELLSRKHELEKSREGKRKQPAVTDFVKRAESLVGEGRLSTAAENLRQASILLDLGRGLRRHYL